jgi:uncharacterized protein YyaL (SSP411 family)
VWRHGRVGSQAFLEDYAAVILGLLDLYQTDFESHWFSAARSLTEEMLERFTDPNGGFFDTPEGHEPLLIRPKDIQDNATPSGSALASEALIKLAALTGEGRYRNHAERALGTVLADAVRYPTSFARWLSVADMALAGDRQLALLYPPSSSAAPFLHIVNAAYRPNLVLQHPSIRRGRKDRACWLIDRWSRASQRRTTVSTLCARTPSLTPRSCWRSCESKRLPYQGASFRFRPFRPRPWASRLLRLRTCRPDRL